MQCNLLHCTGNHISSDAGAPVPNSVTWARLKDPVLIKWLQSEFTHAKEYSPDNMKIIILTIFIFQAQPEGF